MNYKEYYEKRIVYNGKLTESEKETIEKILKSLEEKKMSEDKKKEYIDKLEELLVLLDRDTSLISNVMRTNYNFDLAFNNLLLKIENIKEDEKVSKVKPKKIEKKKNVKKLKVKAKRELDTEIDIKQDIETKNEETEKIEENQVDEEVEKILGKDNLFVIVQQINDFNKTCDEIIKMSDEVLEKIKTINDDKEFLIIKNDFGRIDEKFTKSFGNSGEEVNKLVTTISEYQLANPGVEFSMSNFEIIHKLNLVKEKIKDAKIRYIGRYNLIIHNFNSKIEELYKNIKEKNDSVVHKMPIYEVQRSFAFNDKMKEVKNFQLTKVIDKMDSVSKVEQPKVVKMEPLDERINHLNSVIISFLKELQKQGKIIRDKETRNNIDGIFDKCYGELDELEKEVNKSSIKINNNRKIRINECRNKLDDVSILYRSKCPLLVKKTKSAKELYKKHEKTPLVASGLSSLSMIDFVVGPIIIPAVMCGNMILAKKNKAINDTTKVLARVIDAKECEYGYKLHTGLLLNEHTASLSLLKSIAVCEVREWIAPLVNEAKRLFQKMKNKRHKKDIVNELDKHKEEAINETREEKHKKGRR